MYGGFLEYYFRLQFSAFWSMHAIIQLCHERMLILRCILPPKKLNYLQKKSYPPPRPSPPLPKNSITITETISNTRTKSQPLSEKSQPLV